MHLQPDDVRARLGYAEARIHDLLALNRGDLLGADGHKRQRLSQEVFFHLVGAIELFAQLVNERRNLGRASEDVNVWKLPGWLGATDPLVGHVNGLYVNPKNPAPKSDPYNGDGLMYRIWNYRHQVTHRGANPFLIKLGLGGERRSPRRGFWFSTNPHHGLLRSNPPPDRSGYFLLDPRLPPEPVNVSERTVHIDLDTMLALVKERLETAMSAI